jgi:hypothetical protein
MAIVAGATATLLTGGVATAAVVADAGCKARPTSGETGRAA